MGRGMKTVFIAGGSASGKTWLAERVAARCNGCTLISQDFFYHDRPSGHADDRHAFDFDRPEAIHWDEMRDALSALQQGQITQIPIYDFTVSLRDGYRRVVPEGDVLLVDGTMILHAPQLRGVADARVYVRCPEALRQQRREERDVKYRGRKLEDVRQRLRTQVFPAHDEFVAPSQEAADLILDAEFVMKNPEAGLERILALITASR